MPDKLPWLRANIAKCILLRLEWIRKSEYRFTQADKEDIVYFTGINHTLLWRLYENQWWG